MEQELQEKLEHAMKLKDYKENDVAAAREYVGAMLGFILYSHHLYTFITGWERHDAGEDKGGHDQ
jgi:hypothetical protein